jgi:hypothetical protein
MSIKLGNTTASLYLGSTPVAAYLGTEQVYSAAINTTLLLNFNGEDNSTTFTDSSPNGFTVTANGDAEISTDESKFGGASGYFPEGSGNNLTIDKDDPLLNVGTDDFTIEWWEYLDAAVSGVIGIFCYGGNGQSGQTTQPVIGLRYESGTQFRVGYNTGSLQDFWVNFDMEDFAEADRLVADAWVHAALVRHNGVLKFYRNGNANSTTFDWSAVSLPNADTITPAYTDSIIGSFNGSNPSDYYLDDFRILKGRALYTSNFTPPTAQLGAI